MGVIQEIKTHKYRTWKTFSMALLWMGIGLQNSSYGPSLIDLMAQVDTSIDQITRILPMRAFGSMIGSVCSGFALEYFDVQLVLLFSMLSLSISIFFVPFCISIYQLYVVLLVNGLSCGFLASSGNVFIMHAWSKENGPFMQFSHFMFGVGGFIGPFIVQPFLTETTEELPTSTTNSTIDGPLKEPYIDPSTLKIRYAYIIIGVICMCLWFMYLVTYLKKTSNKPHPTKEIKEKEKSVDVSTNESKDTKCDSNEKKVDFQIAEKSDREIKTYHKVIIVMLGALFCHVAYGIELMYGSMLASYAHLSHLQLSKSNAAFVTSVYWFSFTFFRLISLVIVSFFSTRTMLIFTLTLLMLGNVLLIPLIFVNLEILLWAGSAVIGFAISTAFPCLFTYLELILPVNGKMVSIISSFSCVGEFVLPVLVGLYIKTNPNIFVYIVFIYSVLACVMFALFCSWEQVIKRYRRS